MSIASEVKVGTIVIVKVGRNMVEAIVTGITETGVKVKSRSSGREFETRRIERIVAEPEAPETEAAAPAEPEAPETKASTPETEAAAPTEPEAPAAEAAAPAEPAAEAAAPLPSWSGRAMPM